MNTTEVKKEMAELKDLRIKKATLLKNKFIQLVGEFKEMLDLTDYKKYQMLCLRYYDNRKGNLDGDEKLSLYYIDGNIELRNVEYMFDDFLYSGKWKHQGSYFDEFLVENWEDAITNKIAFDKFDTLVKNIEKLLEDEKRFLEKLDKKLEVVSND